MKCYYETLNLERDCTSDDIKRAYRKLALIWHPDKNPDNAEESKAEFTLIQQAYDVLSDVQERAWYDRHRDKILKGGIDDNFEDDAVNLFPFFSASCFKGYSDNDEGFYSVYRSLFQIIAQQDLEYMEDDQSCVFPSFGTSSSDYDETVGPFYGFWSSYFTQRSYAWLDKYDIRQADNRRVVRAMEKENTKLRSAAKKTRNDEIKMLVTFVKKRDRRVKVHREQLEKESNEKARKVAEHAQSQRRKHMDQIDNELVSKIREDGNESHENELQSIENELFGQATCSSDGEQGTDNENPDVNDDPDDDFMEDALFCVACNKRFKTEKAMINHEKSKNHRENVRLLKNQMKEEEFALLNLNGEPDNNVNSVSNPNPSGKKSKRQKRNQRQQQMCDPEDEGDVSS